MSEKILESAELAREVVGIIADKKGEDVVLLDIRGKTIIADYFVICSASSERQLKAIVEGITEEIKKRHRIHARSTDHEAETGWALIDLGNIVVHVFSPATRTYYNLEGFWLEHEATILLKMQ
jgi:ribosome-associated protein